MKSPVGACNLWPLFFIFSYFLLFCCQGQEEEVTQGTFFPFVARDRRKKLHRERAVFFFPFAARDRRRKLHRERAVFCFPFVAKDRRRKLHRERAVFCFPFAAKDRRRKLHPALQDRQTDR